MIDGFQVVCNLNTLVIDRVTFDIYIWIENSIEILLTVGWNEWVLSVVVLVVVVIVTQAGFGSRVNWIYHPAPLAPRRATPHSTNSSVSISCDSVHSHDKPVSVHNNHRNKASAIDTRGSSWAPPSPALPEKCWRRRRRQARRAANRNSEAISAAPVTPYERWANQHAAGHAGATQTQPEDSDPTSTRRTAVYPPSRIVGDSSANENSPFQLGLESSRIPGLYKPAIPDQQQDTPARIFRVKNSGSGIASPPYLLPYTKPFSGRTAGSSLTSPTRDAGEAQRSRSGIVYPLLPRAHRPDTSVTVDAALPEPAAFQLQDLPPTVVEIGSPSQPQTPPASRRRASRKLSRKRPTQPLYCIIPASQTLTIPWALVWLRSP